MINPITEQEFLKIKELCKSNTAVRVATILNRSGASILRANHAFDWADYVARKKVYAEKIRTGGNLNLKTDAKIKGIRTFQARVLATFMSPADYEALLKRYNENKRGMGVELRERNLKLPLTKNEKLALLKYLNLSPGQPIRELLGTKGYFATDVNKIAAKFLYQNKELFKLDKLLDGGENE